MRVAGSGVLGFIRKKKAPAAAGAGISQADMQLNMSAVCRCWTLIHIDDYTVGTKRGLIAVNLLVKCALIMLLTTDTTATPTAAATAAAATPAPDPAPTYV